MVRDGVKGLLLNSTATFCFYLRTFFSSSCAIGSSSTVIYCMCDNFSFSFFEFLSLIVTTRNEIFEPKLLFNNYQAVEDLH